MNFASAITSANSTISTVGSSGSFTLTATGSPTPTLSESGTLPSGVSFNTSTGVLGGTPASGTNGTYSITFTASNGIGSNATQSFTLTVGTTGPTVYYYLGDALGSSRVITDSNGTVCYDADFYPYGGERTYTNTCAQNYKFEGKERDSESGLDDFGARYYSSQYGRWMSADWSAIPAPVPYANLSNPQTLNLYAMVSDNPETFADLDGHCGASPTRVCDWFVTPASSDEHEEDAEMYRRVTVTEPSDTVSLTPLEPPQSQKTASTPVVVVTSDTKHPNKFHPGVIQRDRIYAPGKMDEHGNVEIDYSGRRVITMTETKIAGNDNPTNCASGCVEPPGPFEDQISVTARDKWSTFRQTFQVDNNPAYIVSGTSTDLATTRAQIVRANADNIEIDPTD